MKLTLSIFFLALCALNLHGQGAMSEMAAIRASYSILPDRKLDGLNTEIGLDQWEIQAPFFYKKLDSWMIAGGLRYQSTGLDFSDTSLLDEDRLHSIGLALFLSKKQSDTLDWIFLFNPSLAGDLEDVDGDAMNYMTIAGAKWKTSETFEWIFGAVYTTGLGDDLFVPAIGFTWEASDRSSLLFAGPIIRYKYGFSDSLDLVLSGGFSGNRWNTQSTKYTGTKQERNFRLRSYRVSASLKWNMDEHHALFATGGIDFARIAEIELLNETELLDRDLKFAPSLELGYKYQF
jgi:hypothetical protein